MFDCDKILILSPHPDDEMLGCGGLISYAKKNKKDVFVLYYSLVLLGIDQIAQVNGNFTYPEDRVKEINSASAFGQFNYNLLEYEKFDFTLMAQLIEGTEKIIQDYKPDVVCLPSQNSYNQDHREVFNAAFTALRPIPQGMRHFCPCVLEYEEPYSWTVGENFKPNFYLSMSEDDLKFKLKLIEQHYSQMRVDPYSRSVENIKRIAQIRGAESGQEFAEAYKIHRIVG